MKKLVIFDLDGTLLNTIDDLGTATNYALSAMGLPTHPLSAYPAMVGNGVRKLIERALPRELSNDEHTVATITDSFKQYYNEHSMDHSRPYDGIMELLSELNGRGLNLAVASNKYDAAVKVLINHYFPDFRWAAICGQKEGVPVKPDPSIVFDILNQCPTPKDNVLYVGDSGVDMTTAYRACVESVGVTWGFRPASELRECYANHIVNHPTDILDFV